MHSFDDGHHAHPGTAPHSEHVVALAQYSAHGVEHSWISWFEPPRLMRSPLSLADTFTTNSRETVLS